jgi:hypothetical protein
VAGLAFAYLAFAFSIVMTWYFPRLGAYVPKLVSDVIYPISKTNLDLLRILHFFSLAVITVWFVPRAWPALKSPAFWPAIVCGQHSLETLCLGAFLSFAVPVRSLCRARAAPRPPIRRGCSRRWRRPCRA